MSRSFKKPDDQLDKILEDKTKKNLAYNEKYRNRPKSGIESLNYPGPTWTGMFVRCQCGDVNFKTLTEPPIEVFICHWYVGSRFSFPLSLFYAIENLTLTSLDMYTLYHVDVKSKPPPSLSHSPLYQRNRNDANYNTVSNSNECRLQSGSAFGVGAIFPKFPGIPCKDKMTSYE